MTGAQYIAASLIRRGVTDTFGLPGGVVLSLLYAFESHRPVFTPHLSYHEQCAGFAACGYAQGCGRLGVAYATKGPGFTNLLTPMADAYYDSLPTLFLTAHASPLSPEGIRTLSDQEMDTCTMVRPITKAAARLDDISTFATHFEALCDEAMSGRKGPVFIDVSTRILTQEIPTEEQTLVDRPAYDTISTDTIVDALRSAKRPVLLVGDGIHQGHAEEELRTFAEKCGIPVISSRFSHDLMGTSNLYYGYIGSHGMRSANFILSKTDLILSLGNRLHFPPHSASFGNIPEQARIIRCDIDANEFIRDIPNATNLHADVRLLLSALSQEDDFGSHEEWLSVCDKLREELWGMDIVEPIDDLSTLLRQLPPESILCNDVGNHEFWVSRACVLNGVANRTHYSKSFAAIGSGIGKAIGIHYATHKPVVCFVGDQSLQMNIQELQYISQHQLPIWVVLLNNQSSGMIKDREASIYGKPLHTTKASGYSLPPFEAIAAAYGMKYVRFDRHTPLSATLSVPMFIEVVVDENIPLIPNLPKGRKCQDMTPSLPKMKYDELDQL